MSENRTSCICVHELQVTCCWNWGTWTRNMHMWWRYPGKFEMSKYMILTSHRIMEINASNLGLVGSLKLEYTGKVTRQMVYITKIVRELYLSKAACRELWLIEGNFPCVIESIGLAAAISENGPCQGDCTINHDNQCLIRKETPLRPSTILFKSLSENRE